MRCPVPPDARQRSAPRRRAGCRRAPARRVRNWTLPPSASLPYCALDGPRTISIDVEHARLDQVEEGVDAAALRAVRVADAVHEDVDLVAGQPAHEHAGHGRARALQLHARLRRRPPAATTVLTRSTMSREEMTLTGWPDGADVLREAGRRRDGHVFLERRELDRDLNRLHPGLDDGDGLAGILEPRGAREQEIAPRDGGLELEPALGIGLRRWRSRPLGAWQ